MKPFALSTNSPTVPIIVVTVSAISSIPFFLARAVTGCVYAVYESDGTSISYVIKNVSLPELALNVTSVFFMYLIVSFIYTRIKRRLFF